MVRPADRPLMQVEISFEVTRFSAQHLIDAYAQLVPVIRRRSTPPACRVATPAAALMTQGGNHG